MDISAAVTRKDGVNRRLQQGVEVPADVLNFNLSCCTAVQSGIVDSEVAAERY